MTHETTSIEDKLTFLMASSHQATCEIAMEAVSTIKELREKNRNLFSEFEKTHTYAGDVSVELINMKQALSKREEELKEAKENGKDATILLVKYYDDATGYGPSEDDERDAEAIDALKEYFNVS
jgi:hypothetical protein